MGSPRPGRPPPMMLPGVGHACPRPGSAFVAGLGPGPTNKAGSAAPLPAGPSPSTMGCMELGGPPSLVPSPRDPRGQVDEGTPRSPCEVWGVAARNRSGFPAPGRAFPGTKSKILPGAEQRPRPPRLSGTGGDIPHPLQRVLCGVGRRLHGGRAAERMDICDPQGSEVPPAPRFSGHHHLFLRPIYKHTLGCSPPQTHPPGVERISPAPTEAGLTRLLWKP